MFIFKTTWKSYFKNNEKNTWKFTKKSGKIMEIWNFISPKKWEPCNDTTPVETDLWTPYMSINCSLQIVCTSKFLANPIKHQNFTSIMWLKSYWLKYCGWEIASRFTNVRVHFSMKILYSHPKSMWKAKVFSLRTFTLRHYSYCSHTEISHFCFLTKTVLNVSYSTFTCIN